MAEAVDEKRGRRDGKVTVSRCMEFRINPTMEQKILIWKTFGCCRFVWNNLLQERIGYEKINKGKLLNSFQKASLLSSGRKGRTRGHIPPTGRTTTSRLFTKVIERTTSSFRNWEECASYSTVAYRTNGG